MKSLAVKVWRHPSNGRIGTLEPLEVREHEPERQVIERSLPEAKAKTGATMFYGKIVSYCERKQWGFIQGNSEQQRIFFHRANCVQGFQPQLGDDIEYEIGKPFTLGKPEQAVDVRGTNS